MRSESLARTPWWNAQAWITRERRGLPIRIYIKNLPFCLEPEALESALRDILGSFGDVKQLTFVYEGTALRPKGLCFAEVGKPEQARAIIRELNGISVAGYRLALGFARPVICRRPRSGSRKAPRRQHA